jgi:hypothetical protein
MSYLHISQSMAQWIVSLQLSRWVLLAAILLMVIVLGFFLPPVSIILMTAPIILPPLKAAGFDLVWFGVVMTIVMEMGLIHPPVGLNLFVIKNISPDIPLRDVVWSVMPFVGLMMFAVVCCAFSPASRRGLPTQSWARNSAQPCDYRGAGPATISARDGHQGGRDSRDADGAVRRLLQYSRLSLYPISYARRRVRRAQYRPDARTGQLLGPGRRRRSSW